MDALQRSWGWFLGLGIVLAVLGVLAIALPVVATLAVGIFIGWLLVIGGIAQLVHAFSERRWRGFFLHFLGGLVYLVVGGLILIDPFGGALALTILLAAFLVVEGIFQILLALRIRPFRNWGWVVASGIITLVLGILIFAGWPSTALWVIGLLVGIHLLTSGIALIMLGLAARSVVQSAREQPAS
ncbi:MAG: HdeD family acid-resistance protein [Geminicoccaceae bacterium]